MHEGVGTAKRAYTEFLDLLGWDGLDIDKSFCHQVGRAHHKLLFEALDLDPAIDYGTLEFLGNTGSVALPTSVAMGIENGHLQKDDRVGLFGIGSGINALMLGVDWQTSLLEEPAAQSASRVGQGLR
jgi:3-oxoacyl-[acyl-carrier-protein] synthase-3